MNQEPNLPKFCPVTWEARETPGHGSQDSGLLVEPGTWGGNKNLRAQQGLPTSQACPPPDSFTSFILIVLHSRLGSSQEELSPLLPTRKARRWGSVCQRSHDGFYTELSQKSSVLGSHRGRGGAVGGEDALFMRGGLGSWTGISQWMGVGRRVWERDLVTVSILLGAGHVLSWAQECHVQPWGPPPSFLPHHLLSFYLR